MRGFVSNIASDTLDNSDFRKVLYTAKHSQLVLMAVKPGDELGMEVHTDNDQFFRFEQGQGKVYVDGNESEVLDGFAVVVPAGAQHNVVNVGTGELKLYTIYSPAHHQDGVVRPTKHEAEADSPEFDGMASLPARLGLDYGQLSVAVDENVVSHQWFTTPSLTFEASEPIEVMGDATSLRQVMDNLLGNVRAHTPPGTTALVTVTSDGTGAVMLDGKMEDDASLKQCQVLLELAERLSRTDPELAQLYAAEPGAGSGAVTEGGRR